MKVYTLPSGVRVTQRGYEQWRVDQGLCRKCDQPIAPRSSSRCERHLISDSNGAKGYRSTSGPAGRNTR